MTVNPGAGGIERVDRAQRSPRPTLDETRAGPTSRPTTVRTATRPAADAVTGPVDMSAAGKLMSPALMAAHYRLGRQPAGRARPASRSIRPTTPAGSVRRCRSSPTTRRC